MNKNSDISKMNSEKKKSTRIYAQDYVGWRFYAGVQFIVCTLPAWLLYFVADVMGALLFKFEKKSRGIVEDNLRLGPKVEEKKLHYYARKVFQNFCKNTMDLLRFEKFNARWFSKYVSTVNISNLQNAFNRGKGVIVISAHLGHVEIGAYLAHLSGIPMNSISLSHSNPKVEELFVNQRIKKGLKVILTGGAMEGILDALQRREAVGIVMDHSYSKRGADVNFFGKKAIIPKGVAIAAIKTGAPIVPAVAVRQGRFGFKAIFGEEIKYELSGDKDRDIDNILQQCVGALEPFIREYPDQWVLFRRCWHD
jgi:Kdo2-lipid IVA lauroyltransferase/acyltransferase